MRPASSWIGCIGNFPPSVFTETDGIQTVRGKNYALQIQHGNGESVTLNRDAQGQIRAGKGDPDWAGCAARIDLSSGSPSVLLTCDPFGLHGIFTAQVGETFWFASDINLLRQAAQIPNTLNLVALHGYLCFGYVPTPTTLYNGISTLPAGSSVTITPQSSSDIPLQTEALWQEQKPFLTDETQATIDLRERLQQATARQLGEAREVAVFLSGGLDSSLVAALLSEMGVRLHLFTLDFGEPYNAELAHAQTVAAHLKRPLHVVPAHGRQIAKSLYAAASAMQQPFGDPVCVPLYLLGVAASQYAEIAFTGEFGDQLFGGWANKPMIAAELYGSSEYNRKRAYLATYHRFLGLTDTLYTPEMKRATADLDAGDWIRPALEQSEFSSLLHQLRAANLSLKGAQNIAPRSRQLAEACGLRVRSPFCDPELTAWTFACPPEWFLQGAQEKYLLKRVAESYLPASIIWREKRGMGVPATQWCGKELRREIARILHPRRIKQDGLFRPETVQMLRKGEDFPVEFRSRRLGERLWTLLMLHVWQLGR